MPSKINNYSSLLNIARDLKETCSIPGYAIGLINGDDKVTDCRGITHIDNPLPINEDTIFQIGSITKTFTALALMELMEEGAIELDTPINLVLQDFHMADDNVTECATVRHLFTHTGGWEGDCFDCPDMGEATLKEFMKIIGSLPQIFPLGRMWAYNSTGFSIAGRIIEVLTGLPYEKAVRKLVLDPLGMSQSTFKAEEAILKRTVVGHYVNEYGVNQIASPWALPRALNPSGGLASSLRDMMEYATYMLRPENYSKMKCQRNTVSRMFEFQCEASGKADAVGLSWMIKNAGDIRIIRHGGVTFGQCAEIMLIPDSRFALVILTNSGNGSELIEEVSDFCLREYFNIQYKKPSPIDYDTSCLSFFEGIYGGLVNDIEVKADGKELLIKYNYKPLIEGQVVPPTPPPMHAFFYDKYRALIRENGVKCDFFEDELGNIALLRHGNKVHSKWKRNLQ